jgi:hypothetical protein
MQAIGTEWAKTDPTAALDFAASHPGGLGSALATSVLTAWAKSDLNAAADWLSAADDHTRNRLSPTLVEAWGSQDPSAALEWCQDNLSGSTLAQAVGGVVKAVAAKDVAAAADLVSGMDPSPARSEAAVAVAQKWFPELSSDTTLQPQTLAWLGNLDPDSVRRVLDQVQWGWATSDPKTMADFLSSAPKDEVPASAYSILARQIARQKPVQALAWANTLPADPGIAAGGNAFAEWRRSQPEAATQWLSDLPQADPRRDAFFESAIRSLAYDSQASQQLAALTGPDRATARGVIESMHLPDDRRSQLLQALQSP